MVVVCLSSNCIEVCSVSVSGAGEASGKGGCTESGCQGDHGEEGGKEDG